MTGVVVAGILVAKDLTIKNLEIAQKTPLVVAYDIFGENLQIESIYTDGN